MTEESLCQISKSYTRKDHCCVPDCNNDARFGLGKFLSYHHFPVDKDLRQKWLINIRKDKDDKFKVLLLGFVIFKIFFCYYGFVGLFELRLVSIFSAARLLVT